MDKKQDRNQQGGRIETSRGTTESCGETRQILYVQRGRTLSCRKVEQSCIEAMQIRGQKHDGFTERGKAMSCREVRQCHAGRQSRIVQEGKTVLCREIGVLLQHYSLGSCIQTEQDQFVKPVCHMHGGKTKSCITTSQTFIGMHVKFMQEEGHTPVGKQDKHVQRNQEKLVLGGRRVSCKGTGLTLTYSWVRQKRFLHRGSTDILLVGRQDSYRETG